MFSFNKPRAICCLLFYCSASFSLQFDTLCNSIITLHGSIVHLFRPDSNTICAWYTYNLTLQYYPNSCTLPFIPFQRYVLPDYLLAIFLLCIYHKSFDFKFLRHSSILSSLMSFTTRPLS